MKPVHIFFVMVALFAPCAASGDDAAPQKRLIVFSQELVDPRGKQLGAPVCVKANPAEGKCEEWTPFTLGFACYTILSAVIDADKQERDMRSKWERDDLARKIARSEVDHVPVALTAKEIVLLRDRAPLVYPSAVLSGTIVRLIDPDAGAEAAK
jgi:hypothetical protein